MIVDQCIQHVTHGHSFFFDEEGGPMGLQFLDIADTKEGQEGLVTMFKIEVRPEFFESVQGQPAQTRVTFFDVIGFAEGDLTQRNAGVVEDLGEAVLGFHQVELQVAAGVEPVALDQGVVDRHAQSHERGLDHVVVHAFFDGVEQGFFRELAGDQYEGNLQPFLLDQLQGLQACEHRQGVIGNDYVRRAFNLEPG